MFTTNFTDINISCRYKPFLLPSRPNTDKPENTVLPVFLQYLCSPCFYNTCAPRVFTILVLSVFLEYLCSLCYGYSIPAELIRQDNRLFKKNKIQNFLKGFPYRRNCCMRHNQDFSLCRFFQNCCPGRQTLKAFRLKSPLHQEYIL